MGYRTHEPDCPLTRPHVHGECDGCGKELRRGLRRWCSDRCSTRYWGNHAWNLARWLAINRAAGYCDQCGRQGRGDLEVNHVEPRVGQGYGPGCHHHQTNLQVLCHGCHVAETTRQIRERRGIPDDGRPKPPRAWEAETTPLGLV